AFRLHVCTGCFVLVGLNHQAQFRNLLRRTRRFGAQGRAAIGHTHAHALLHFVRVEVAAPALYLCDGVHVVLAGSNGGKLGRYTFDDGSGSGFHYLRIRLMAWLISLSTWSMKYRSTSGVIRSLTSTNTWDTDGE